jgi:PTS system mannose-specific IIC component
MNGLKTAGIILPAMGIAILMRYLPLKRYYPYFILGFALMAYFAKQFSLLGLALVGFLSRSNLCNAKTEIVINLKKLKT